MFRFSQEFDEEVEDFLSIPLDNESSKNEGNSIREENVKTGQVNSSTTKDEFVFDNFGEDEELLSFVENIDSTFSQSIQNSSLNASSSLHCSEPKNGIPPVEFNTVTTRKKHVQERLDSFVSRTSISSSRIASKRSSKFVTTGDESPSPLKLKYEREFPGPAGLRLKRSGDSVLNEELNDSGFKQQLNVCVVNDFLSENINWIEMMKDINAQSCEQSKILNEFTVVALKRLGNVARKVPIFAAVIFNINASTSEPSAILKDATGIIRASFDEDLWGQYSHLLTVGSALLLRKVGMLSKSRRLSLLVTTYNVDSIYSLKPGDESSVLVTRVTQSTILDSLDERNNDHHETASRSSNAVLSLNGGTVRASETSPNANKSSNISCSVSKVAKVDNMIGATRGLTNSRTDTSIPSSVSAIDNELEGVDLDSFLGDF